MGEHRTKRSRAKPVDLEERVSEICDRDGRVAAVFLHGSMMSSTVRPDSDVDLALLPAVGEQVGGRKRLQIAGKLQSALGRPVDIGVMDHRNLVYEKEVATSGRCIYCRDATYRDEFLALSLSLYVQLRLERQEVERAYGIERDS